MSKTIYTKIRDYHFEYFEYDMKCAVIGLVKGYSMNGDIQIFDI